MRMRKAPYIFFIVSCLVCLFSLFLFNNAANRAENNEINNPKTPVLAKVESFQEKAVQIDKFKNENLDINTSDRLENKIDNQACPKVEQFSQEIIQDSDQKPFQAKFHAGRILVKFSQEEMERIKQGEDLNLHGKIGRMVSKGGFYEVIPEEGESVEELLDKYNTDFSSKVQYAQLDYECEIQDKDDDEPDFEKMKKKVKRLKNKKPKEIAELMWHLDAINISEAWQKTKGKKSVVIAILDTGIAFENFVVPGYESETVDSEYYLEAPYLKKARIWKNKAERRKNKKDDDKNGYVDDRYGYDFVNRDNHPNDNNGHGTHLANIVGHNFKMRRRPFSARIANFIYKTGIADLMGKGMSSKIASFISTAQYNNLIYENTKLDKRVRTGIAPKCSIMNLKVLNHKGKGFSSSIAEAIYYAVDNGADVINLSFAWPPNLDPGPIIHDAIIFAANAGVIMVSGSGNNSRSTVCYPAAYDEVIAVGSIQYDYSRAYYSNYGHELEIVAPGGNIWEDQNLDGFPDGILMQSFDPRYRFSVDGETLANTSKFMYDFIHGTSVATAQVTGIVALLLSVDSNLSLSNIRSIISSTSLDLGPSGWDREYGYGLINAGEAVMKAINGDYDELPQDDGGDDDDYNYGTDDLDGDGYASIYDGGNDCDDYDPAIYPGAYEIPYDGIDQDCDGSDLTDIDNDGFNAIDVGGTDCDDYNQDIHPGALEIAEDGIDQDCDGDDNTSTGVGWIEDPDSCDDMGWEGDCESCSNEAEIELECS